MARDDSPELVAELDRLDETAKAIPAGNTTAQIALRRRAALPEHRFFLGAALGLADPKGGPVPLSGETAVSMSRAARVRTA